MDNIVKHLDNINLQINNHYENITKLRAEKQQIYNRKFYKINKKIIKEKVAVKKKGKYNKKQVKGLTFINQATTIYF